LSAPNPKALPNQITGLQRNNAGVFVSKVSAKTGPKLQDLLKRFPEMTVELSGFIV
jgi:hypothetical protein